MSVARQRTARRSAGTAARKGFSFVPDALAMAGTVNMKDGKWHRRNPVPRPRLAWEKRGWRQPIRASRCRTIPIRPRCRRLNASLNRSATGLAGEARRLRATLGDVAAGRAFLLQGGIAPKAFRSFGRQYPRHVQGDVADGGGLTWARSFRWSRSAAWRASSPSRARLRPRSSAAPKLPSYRGDIINGFDFTPEARIPDPQRMLSAYTQAAAFASNLLRAFDRRLCRHAPGAKLDQRLHRRRQEAARYRDIADRISDAMAFHGGGWRHRRDRAMTWQPVDFYTSHEALLLNTKRRWRGSIPPPARRSRVGPHDLDWRPHAAGRWRACRICPRRRTRSAWKCGPLDQRQHLKALIAKLNLEKRAGRLTLIARFGAPGVATTCRA